ncbi:MAG: hypothetical protein M1308_18815 [Actinobacteria bacterium]|nr:hypothetical protein [Actinomycetota bacterium]
MRTKLTEAVIEVISKKIKAGCYAKVVAASIGIVEKTYYNWLDRGKRAENLAEIGKKVPKEEKIFLQFLQSIRQSQAEANVKITSMIFAQAPTDWRAALTILARKWPKEWGKKDYVGFRRHIDREPYKKQEALNEPEEPFAGIPKAKLSEIILETTRKLYEAKNAALKKKDLENNNYKPD